MCDPLSTNWLLTGSNRGVFCLWDVRFLLPVHTWQHPLAAPISSLALAAAPPAALGMEPGSATGPLVRAVCLLLPASTPHALSPWANDFKVTTCMLFELGEYIHRL